jgi:hypothetical protein
MSSASVTNNFTNGLIGDADEVDQNFQDLVNFLNSHVVHNHDPLLARHGVRLHKAASAIASGSPTSITWGDEREDTDGYWSAGASVTIPAGMAGPYVITFVSTGVLTGRAYLDVIPTITSGLVDIPARWRGYVDPAEDMDTLTVSTVLGVGDSFVCQVFHSTGSSVTFESWISAYRVSA